MPGPKDPLDRKLLDVTARVVDTLNPTLPESIAITPAAKRKRCDSDTEGCGRVHSGKPSSRKKLNYHPIYRSLFRHSPFKSMCVFGSTPKESLSDVKKIHDKIATISQEKLPAVTEFRCRIYPFGPCETYKYSAMIKTDPHQPELSHPDITRLIEGWGFDRDRGHFKIEILGQDWIRVHGLFRLGSLFKSTRVLGSAPKESQSDVEIMNNKIPTIPEKKLPVVTEFCSRLYPFGPYCYKACQYVAVIETDPNLPELSDLDITRLMQGLVGFKICDMFLDSDQVETLRQGQIRVDTLMISALDADSSDDDSN